MKSTKYFRSSLFCCLFWSVTVVFSQKPEHIDDETLYQLKRALAPYIVTTPLPHSSNTPLKPSPVESLRHGKSNEKIQVCGVPFVHGVASGDPLNDRVIIWTRWTPPLNFVGQKSVRYQISDQLSFTNILQDSILVTDSSKDFTLKKDVLELQSGTYYYFRFIADQDTSVIGRTKTASVGNIDQVRLAFVNCNDYRRGYFNTYHHLSVKNDVDAVVHLGDYIYETGGGPVNREHDPNAEIWQLNDYRTRYSQYRLDTNLARCHQVYPFIQIWDDHDIVVDATSDTSNQHQAQYGNYHVRRDFAVQAFREWNPVRDVSAVNPIKNWRKFTFGDLLDVYMLDVRLYDRSLFAVDVNDTIYNSPYAKMCGPEQLAWLKSELQQSTAQWKIIANGLMFGQFQVAGIPLVFENWDGYNFERNQILDLIDTADIKNVVVYSGDFHCSFATNLAKDPYNFMNYNPFNGEGSLAVEFIPPSASSDNFDEGIDFGLGQGNAGLAQILITTSNPHIRYCDLTNHGYGLLDITSSQVQNEFWYMQNIQDPNNTNGNAAAIWRVLNQTGKLTEGGSVTSANFNVALPPPSCLDPQANTAEISPYVVHLYPNPFNNWIKIEFLNQANDPITFAIYDATGKKIALQTKQDFDEGQHIYWINTEALLPGYYQLTLLQNGKESGVKKIVKL
jgi:alkaline phosphatase D